MWVGSRNYFFDLSSTLSLANDNTSSNLIISNIIMTYLLGLGPLEISNFRQEHIHLPRSHQLSSFVVHEMVICEKKSSYHSLLLTSSDTWSYSGKYFYGSYCVRIPTRWLECSLRPFSESIWNHPPRTNMSPVHDWLYQGSGYWFFQGLCTCNNW